MEQFTEVDFGKHPTKVGFISIFGGVSFAVNSSTNRTPGRQTDDENTIAMQVITEFDAEELLALARMDVDNGNIAEALYKVKSGLALDSYPDDLIALAGKIYAQMGLFDRAAAYLDEFLAKSPDSITEKFERGMIHLDTKEPQLALETWNDVLQTAPTHPPSLYYCAIANLTLKQVAEANRHINVLLKSAEVDNLYYGKAKKLLVSIKNGVSQPNEDMGSNPHNINTEFGIN